MLKETLLIILSYFFKLKIIFLNLFFFKNKFKFGYGSIFFNKMTINGNNNIINIGNNVIIRKSQIKINGQNNSVTFLNKSRVYENLKILIEGDNCCLQIGKKTTVGEAVFQLGESNTTISIGNNSMISRDVRLNTSDFHSILDKQTKSRINQAKSIYVGNNVWIGNGTYINKGVSIGDDSIVAAKGLVSQGVYPSNVILAGVPAKIIKENIVWSREKL